MRDGNPSNQANWALVCSVCGAEFGMTEMVDLANGHFQSEHPDLDHPHFNTIWRGKGPAPKANQPPRGGPRGRGRKRR